MANHKSAIKRAKQNENRRLANKAVKTRVKGMVKAVRQAMEAKEPPAFYIIITASVPCNNSFYAFQPSKGIVFNKFFGFN